MILLTALFKTVLNIDVLVEMANPNTLVFTTINGYTREQIQQALTWAEKVGLITHIEGRYYLVDDLITNNLKSELQKRPSLRQNL